MRDPRRLLVLGCLGAALAACGDDPLPDLSLDAGASSDAASVDAGPDDAGTTPTDAALADAAPADTGSGDAGGGDTGSADAGRDDAGAADAGDADTGAPDGGPEDAGATDGGERDGGPQDAGGDAGAADVGSSDAGPGADAGTAPTCNPNFGQTPPTCGGNPAGTWTIREACGDSLLLQQLANQCPGATVTNVSRRASGTLAVQGSSYTLRLTDSSSADLTLPALCALAVGGCAAVPSVIANAGGTATCMANSAGDCACQVNVSTMRSEAGPFMQMGATLIAGSNTYDHCVTGRAMEIRERMSGSVYVLGQ